MEQSIIPKISRDIFNRDSDRNDRLCCLTVIETLNKDNKYQYYKVEHISVGLHKKIIVIGVYD